MKSIEFYYDFGSPTAYLAWTQLEKADDTKFNIEYKPVLLGGIFKATDNKPPGTVKAKADWMFEDIKMYANSYGVNFAMNNAFPVNTLYLVRGAIFAKQKGILKEYNKAMFNAMWINNINLNEPKNIIEVLESNNFDSKEFLEAAENNDIKEELKADTSLAVTKGLFGVPSFIVDGKLYFGQDRMQWFLN